MVEKRVGDYIVLAIAVVNVSAASILVRLSNVHGYVAASWRLLIGSILTLFIYLYLKRRFRLESPINFKHVFYMALSGVSLALHFTLWMESLRHLAVGASVTIVDAYPALLAIIGTTIFKERYSWREYIGIIITFIGISSLTFESFTNGYSPPGGDPILGSIYALLGMFAVSIYFSIGKAIRASYDTISYTLVVYTVAAITSILMTIYEGIPLLGYPLESYLYLLLLGIVPMVGGHTLLNYLLSRMKLAAVTVPVITEPIVSSILAYILFGEALPSLIILYMSLSILGISLVLTGGIE